MRLTEIAGIILLGVVLVSAIACGSSSGTGLTPTPDSEFTPTPASVEGFIIFTDDVNGFSISVPDTWEPELIQTGDFFYAPSACGGWPASIAVTASYEAGYTDVQAYYDEVFRPYIEDFNGYRFVSEEDMIIGGIPSIKVIYSYSGTEGDSVQEMACVMVNQQIVWFVVGSCITACWDTYADTFCAAAQSLHLLE